MNGHLTSGVTMCLTYERVVISLFKKGFDHFHEKLNNFVTDFDDSISEVVTLVSGPFSEGLVLYNDNKIINDYKFEGPVFL